MILERIAVSGFRAFAEPLTFTPDARFTVLHAPNGTGKSTLLDALYYGLLERHSVTGAGAEQRFKSIGRELTPAIEIDFAVDNIHYRLRKAFLTNAKSAALQRLESGRYVALKDGAAADDFVRELFSAQAPGRGAIEPTRHLGFAHVLWSPARASFGSLPDSAGDRIRAMLGGAALAVTDGERAVQERVAAQYAHFFKDDGGYTTRAGSADVPALDARLTRARAAEVEAREQYLRLDRLNIEYVDRDAEAQRMNALRARLRGEVERAKGELEVYTGLKHKAERAARTETEARVPYDVVANAIRTLAAVRAERDVLVRSRSACRSELEALAAAAALLNERFMLARTAVENSGAAVAEVRRRADGVTAARSYTDSREAVERLQSQLVGYDTAAATFAHVSAEQTAIVAPTRAELEALRAAGAELETLRATIAASALSVEFEARTDVTIEIIAGANPGPLSLAAGSTATIAAADESVVVDVPGVGRIRARGTDGAAKARKKLRPLVGHIAAVRERYGSASIAELAQRTERAEDLKRSADQARTAMQQLLGDKSIGELRDSLAQAAARVAAFESRQPQWRDDRPDAPALRAALDRDLHTATDASTLAQLELRAVEAPKIELDTKIARLRTAAAELAIKENANTAQLQIIESDGYDDDARAEQERTLALTWSAARAEQTEITAALARFVEDPRAKLSRLEAEERDAGSVYEQALGEAQTCRAMLDMQAHLGSYAKLAAAEEQVAQCESDLAAARAQASAIACLSAAFDRIRAERVATVVGPITRASTQYLTRIAGSSMGKIDIGHGFAPSGLIETASQMRIPIDGTLSTGEKEQIYLATRLALAEVIAKDRGRQLFVVDDALTATDPSRLRRFVAILEELSRERLQVIVTTADRSRYLGISGAKHIDLAATLLAESAA